MEKTNNLVEKIVLFAVFFVFAALVVAFAYGWDDIMAAKSSNGDTLSFSYITSSKSDSADDSQNVTKRVNINTAAESELDELPGIGLTRARAIIEYRNENGAFKSIADIKNVSGIGDGVFEEIKDYITVD